MFLTICPSVMKTTMNVWFRMTHCTTIYLIGLIPIHQTGMTVPEYYNQLGSDEVLLGKDARLRAQWHGPSMANTLPDEEYLFDLRPILRPSVTLRVADDNPRYPAPERYASVPCPSVPTGRQFFRCCLSKSLPAHLMLLDCKGLCCNSNGKRFQGYYLACSYGLHTIAPMHPFRK